jgi:imidazolonepropionase-like amidohydrolase
MRNRVWWCLVLGVALLVLRPGMAAQWLELSNFTLFDGTGEPAREVGRLLARDGEIITIDEEGEGASPMPGEVVTSINLDGAFVIPGLIDTHVHLANYPRPRHELVDRLSWSLDHGVTMLRDLGSDARVLSELARAVERGDIVGPRIRVGAIFGGETLFDHMAMQQAAPGFTPGQAPWLRAVSADAELPVLVAMARGAGAQALKLYGDLDAGQVAALTAEAQRQGLMAWAHGTVFPASPHELIEAGVQSLSHAPYLIWAAVEDVPADYNYRTRAAWTEIPPDHPDILAVLDLMADRGVVLDTTLAMFRDMTRYRPPEGIEWAMEAFEWGVAVTRLAHERGVPIATGTDAFFPVSPFAPPNTHVELRTLVEDVGLSPAEALVAATRNGAVASGLDDQVGTVAVGKRADLVVLGSDPLADIGASTDIRWVIVDGRVHRRPSR